MPGLTPHGQELIFSDSVIEGAFISEWGLERNENHTQTCKIGLKEMVEWVKVFIAEPNLS